MNIAIIIGVSVYQDTKNNLPGCKNDADAIYKILQKTKKFDDVLYINDNELSAVTKELITNFITDHKDDTIEEFFFYYSGHGQFINDEFFYILSDFDSRRQNRTSLQNSEMDDLIRTLSPNIVIKVIDACQSGTTYIKENNVLNKYFEESKKRFNKCYFFNSSLNNQSSYQDENISFFTKSFISALKQHKSEKIRYKDIIDVIIDEFQENNDQTPFFVIQADFTEKFCSFSSDLREFLNTLKINTTSENPDDKQLSIFEKVRESVKEYVDKEGALVAIQNVKERFDSATLHPALHEFYNIALNYLEDLTTVPHKQVIAKWFKKNNNDFFVTPIYEETYEEEVGVYDVLVDFESGIKLPFKAINIEILTKVPNLNSYTCSVVYFVSKRLFRMFYYVTNYIEKNWDSKVINYKDIKWITLESLISNKDQTSERINYIFQSIESRILNDLHDKFNSTNNTSTEPEPEKESNHGSSSSEETE